MVEYIVRRFVDGVPAMQMDKIEANGFQEAAEKVCGVALTDQRRPLIYLKADVRVVTAMDDHHEFWEVPKVAE